MEGADGSPYWKMNFQRHEQLQDSCEAALEHQGTHLAKEFTWKTCCQKIYKLLAMSAGRGSVDGFLQLATFHPCSHAQKRNSFFRKHLLA
jgi:hypothetical protein